MAKIKFILLFVLLSFTSKDSSISIESKTGSSGTHYTFILKNNAVIRFTDKLPSKANENTLACIPAAFTNTQSYTVDGVYAVNGRIENKKQINTSLGGVLYISNGACRAFQSNKGKLFKDSLYTIAMKEKASFFQQIQCIQNGKAASFKDTKLFQRRGIAILKNNSIAIIESTEAITLKTFSDDLVKLNVQQLIYTDMGAWDEGWYRDPATKKIISIGRDKSRTDKQSNWVVFERK